VELEFPPALDPPNGYHMVVIGCGTYGFVHLCMLNVCLDVSFLLLYGFIQPRWSASNEGDNVMAGLYVTCAGTGNTPLI